MAQELELSAALKHQMLANLKTYTNEFNHILIFVKKLTSMSCSLLKNLTCIFQLQFTVSKTNLCKYLGELCTLKSLIEEHACLDYSDFLSTLLAIFHVINEKFPPARLLIYLVNKQAGHTTELAYQM